MPTIITHHMTNMRTKVNVVQGMASMLPMVFMEPITLSDMRDRDEGGKYRIDGVDITKDGAKNAREFEDMIEGAIAQQGGVKTSCAVWDAKPDPKDVEGHCARTKTGYQDGQMMIAPFNGCSFFKFMLHGHQNTTKAIPPREYIELTIMESKKLVNG